MSRQLPPPVPTRLHVSEQRWSSVMPGLHPMVLHDDTGYVYTFAVDSTEPSGSPVVISCEGRSETAAALADGTPTAS